MNNYNAVRQIPGACNLHFMTFLIKINTIFITIKHYISKINHTLSLYNYSIMISIANVVLLLIHF